MTKKEKVLRRLIDLRRGWFGITDKTFIMYSGLTWLIFNNCYSRKGVEDNDEERALIIIYDNLWFNNEIINQENISDYNPEKLNLSKVALSKITSGKKWCLLNYYYYSSLIECQMLFDPNYNIFSESGITLPERN